MTKPERQMLSAGPGRLHRLRQALRLEEERAALARVRAGGMAPEACGPEMPVSPARGSVVTVSTVSFVPKGETDWRAVAGGFDGRDALRAADVFDGILAAAVRAKAAPPLTPGQVAVARRYRTLVERHAAGGVRCSDLDAAGGAGAGGFMDAFLAEGREIAALRRRIGPGAALAVRRIRPSERGSRREITDRVLVDMVALEGRSLSDVLRAHGWTKQTPQLKALLGALSAALDRMIGYRECSRPLDR